ncbi:O-antigen ligase family protein [Sandarakinorhabdus sp. DWP1-3-1]|uniref:O-antigen ligase family protein n=1 Tax=Sandarakinorhabdus sp. DWP1-3-1 TaxID=2804627 RepID=UPI003CE6CA07
MTDAAALAPAGRGRVVSGRAVSGRDAGLTLLTVAVFFSAYLTWRPFDIMFTLSDGLFCLAALALLAGQGVRGAPFGAFTGAWVTGFLLMILGLLIGSIVNGDPLRWIITTLQYSFAFMVLPFLLVGHGLARTINLARGLVAGVAAMEVFGIAVYVLIDGSFEENRRFGLDFISGSRRLGVFLSDANWNGAVIAMTVPFVLFLAARRQLSQRAAALLLLVFLVGGVLAASVSALACGLTGVAMMMLAGGLRPPPKLIAAGVAGVAIYAATGNGLPAAFGARVLPALESGDLANAGTFSGRLALMQEAWRIVGDTMFVGLGADQYRVVSASGAPVHNVYLLLWAEGGIAALVGWLVMLLVLLGIAAAALRRDRLAGALGLAVTMSFIVSSIASPHMYARMWVVPVLLAVALIFASAEQPRPSKEP